MDKEAFAPKWQFSVCVVPDAFFPGPPGMSAQSKLLWARMAKFAGDKDHCFPSQRTLAREMGLSVRQVQHLLLQLKSFGFIDWEPRINEYGDRVGTNYFFLKDDFLYPTILKNRKKHEKTDEENFVNSDGKNTTEGAENREIDKKEPTQPHEGSFAQNMNKEIESKKTFLDKSKKVESTPSMPIKKKLIRKRFKRSLLDRPVEDTPPPKKQKKPSPLALSLYQFWILSDLPGYKEGTKSLQKTYDAFAALLKGTFFNSTSLAKYRNRAFTEEEIKQVIRNFAKMATDSKYKPESSSYKEFLRKMKPLHFLYNRFAKGDIHSYFVYCLENEPEYIRPAHETLTDKNPEITKKIVNLYKNKYMGGLLSGEITVGQRRKFILVGERLRKFMKDNNHKLLNRHLLTDSKLAEILFNAVTREFNGHPVSPGVFCSDDTFTRRLPQYLVSEGMVMSAKTSRWHI